MCEKSYTVPDFLGLTETVDGMLRDIRLVCKMTDDAVELKLTDLEGNTLSTGQADLSTLCVYANMNKNT